MKSSHLLRTAIHASVLLWAGSSTAAGDLTRVVHFDIPAQPMQSALFRFTEQADVQVAVSSELLVDETSNRVSGELPVQQGLTSLLDGTSLEFAVVNEQTVAIREIGKSSRDRTTSMTGAQGHRPILLAQAAALEGASREASADGASAQASAVRSGETQSAKLEEVVVTGSRIARKDIEAVSPVSVISAAQIAERGYIRFEEMLMHVPQLVTFQSESGRAFVNLRGLGSVRTLTLVNGRRLQPGGYGSSAADPSLVPPGLIKNVEILTGGASSVYGADAVAGVVNFIMDKEFEGFEVSTGVSAFQHDNRNKLVPAGMEARGETWYAKGNSLDGTQYKVDVMAGGKFDSGRGHITAYLGWDESALLRMKDRDYTSCAMGSDGECSGSFEAGRPNFYFPGLGLDATLQDDGSIAAWDGNLANWGSLLSMRHPAKRLRAGAFVNYELSERVNPYFEVNFMRAENRNYYDQAATFGLPVDISCSSPLLSPAQQAEICGPGGLNLGPTDTFGVSLYKRNVEGPARYWDKLYDSSRVVAGVQGGLFSNWRYDVSFLYGNTSSSERGANAFSRPRLINALNLTRDVNGNIVCVSGDDCVPYMVFTPGGITQAALDYVTTDHYIEGDASEYVFNAYAAGDLPITLPMAASPIAFVFGAEYRKESFATLFDDVQRQGDILGRVEANNTVGSYDVREFFTEAVVPLVEGRTLIENLSAELGYRYSQYNLSGDHGTWKIGLNYRPLNQLKFRGGFNRAVRAANVVELFEPQTSNLWNGTDPCAGATPVYSQEQCARTGVAAGQYGLVSGNPVGQFNMFGGGNPQLQPEIADTWTVGLVASPLERLNIGIDYWDIKIDGVIGLIDPQTALSQCALTGETSLCGLIHRAADGNLWRDIQSGVGGFVAGTNANLGSWHFRGVDTSVDYALPLPRGDLRLTLNGSLSLEKLYENVKGVASSRYSCEGLYSSDCDVPNPKWRHSLGATYVSEGAWTASFNWRYFGAVDNPEVDSGIDDGIGAQSYFDLSGTFALGENWNVVAGVNNILDKEPPLVSLNLSTNYFNTVDGYYDMLGRYLHASVTMRF